MHPSYRGEGFFLNFNPSETTISHGDYILSNRDGMMSSYRGDFIDDSCHRSFYLAKLDTLSCTKRPQQYKKEYTP